MLPRGRPVVYRVNDGEAPKMLEEVCCERGWISYDENIHGRNQWNLWWRTNRWPMELNLSTCRFFAGQFVNHIPHGGRITRKDNLARQLRCMYKVYGNIYNFSPDAFILPHEFLKFIGEYNKFKASDHNFWICKPTDQSGGQGIVIFNSVNDLKYSSNVVVQRYISRPFLISGYKFDLRLYVFVPSYQPLVIFVHRGGLVRFGTEKYTLSTLQNRFSHLTNTSINKYGPSFDDGKGQIGPGCKWRLPQLRQFFRQMKVSDWFLWQRISSIITLTLLCQVREASSCTNYGFELYGFDVLIDDELRPWLLEVNRNPSLNHDSDVDVDVKKSMLHDLMDLLGLEQCPLAKRFQAQQTVKTRDIPGTPTPLSIRKLDGHNRLTKSSKNKMPASKTSIKSQSFNTNELPNYGNLFVDDDEDEDDDDDEDDDGTGLPEGKENQKLGTKTVDLSHSTPIHTLIRTGRNLPNKVGEFVRIFPFRSRWPSGLKEAVTIRPTIAEFQSLIKATENVVKLVDKKSAIPTDEECTKSLHRLMGEEIEVWVPPFQ